LFRATAKVYLRNVKAEEAMSGEREAVGTAYEHIALEHMVCRHCGSVLKAVTMQIVGYIGANDSFLCDPKNIEVFHEPAIQ
jgi:hypothetical protein